MANWAFVQEQEIIEVFDFLPKNYRNVSNLDVLENDLEFLKTLGWYKIQSNAEVHDPNTQIIRSIGITFDGENVNETLVIENISTTDLYNTFINLLRDRRNVLLSETDYMCLYDVINTKGPEWATDIGNYRQQLRDLPSLYQNNGEIYNINDVIWPTLPNIKDYPKNT